MYVWHVSPAHGIAIIERGGGEGGGYVGIGGVTGGMPLSGAT